MPVVGQASGGMNFEDMHYPLNGETYPSLAAASEAGAPVIAYGRWINSIINLIIVGFVMFMIVKSYNKIKPPVVEAPAGPTQEELLGEIRDLLKRS